MTDVPLALLADTSHFIIFLPHPSIHFCIISNELRVPELPKRTKHTRYRRHVLMSAIHLHTSLECVIIIFRLMLPCPSISIRFLFSCFECSILRFCPTPVPVPPRFPIPSPIFAFYRPPSIHPLHPPLHPFPSPTSSISLATPILRCISEARRPRPPYILCIV